MPGAVNNEADVVFNRANVALAKSKRLIASWLPPKTENELANEKTEEELEKEDQELFAPVPELLGVGAPLPKDSDGLPRRRDQSAMDALRKQLLGKDALKTKPGASALPNGTKLIRSKPLQSRPKPKVDSEDEEEGRAATITSRKGKRKGQSGKEQPIADKSLPPLHDLKDDNEGVPEESEDNNTPRKKESSKKRPASFLDEVLAEKAKKKKKKKNKKTTDIVESTQG